MIRLYNLVFDGLGGWGLGFSAFVVFIIYRLHRLRSINVDVPTLGANLWLGSWLEAIRFISNSPTLIDAGFQRYAAQGQAFKISTPARWVTVATDPRVIKELQDADENLISMQAAANERNSISYTLSSSIHANPFHVEMIRRNLTQRLGDVLPSVVEEMSRTFREETRDLGADWARLDYDVLARCVSASTSRVLVGLPLCRDEEYLDSMVQLSKAVSRAGLVIDLAPWWCKSAIAFFLVKCSPARRTFLAKLGPLFEARRRESKLGEPKEKRNDVIQWILDALPPSTSIYELCIRILYLDFSATHTTSVSITHALHDLAPHPRRQQQIKDEIEAILQDHGAWTKQALTSMKKLDSTLKESQRIHPVTTATMMRKAQKPHTLADGTFLPAGQWVVVPAYSINHSTENHSDPGSFDPFRFSRMREEAGHENKHQFATPEKGFVSFGMGKHACPGRFFAAAELKVLLAHIVCNYEVRISMQGNQPRDRFFSFSCLPDHLSVLEVRLRRDSKVGLTSGA